MSQSRTPKGYTKASFEGADARSDTDKEHEARRRGQIGEEQLLKWLGSSKQQDDEDIEEVSRASLRQSVG